MSEPKEPDWVGCSNPEDEAEEYEQDYDEAPRARGYDYE